MPRLNGSPLADPDGFDRIPQDCHPRHAGRDFFEQLQPFSAQAVLEKGKSGGIAARSRQARDKPATDRVDGTTTNTIGTVRVACRNVLMVEAPS